LLLHPLKTLVSLRNQTLPLSSVGRVSVTVHI